MGPVVTSQKLSRTFYFAPAGGFDNKQKHQLVLRRTSWCFGLLWPCHVFTKYFARGIRNNQSLIWSLLELQKRHKGHISLIKTNKARAGAFCTFGHYQPPPNLCTREPGMYQQQPMINLRAVSTVICHLGA